MTVDTQHLEPVRSPGRIGQATAVEQSRAVAEVMAAVQVAQACPRDLTRARAEMRRSCAELRMAESAFYSYKRAGSTVTGPTVALARELKRCFGNMQSGVQELRRDDEHGQSELQAWAWDVETNARSSTTVVIPHRNYMTGKPLDALRDVYENNANQGARREREMILGLLPQWYVEEAILACRETIERGDGKPLGDRQERAAKALGSLGVSRERVERRIGRQQAQWTPQDLADLTVLYQSIRTGELRAEDEFPTPTVTAEDITGLAPAQGPVAPPAAPADQQPAAAAPTPLDERQWRAINERFRQLGVTGDGQTARRLTVIRDILGGRQIARGSQLTAADGDLVLDNLAGETGARVVAAALGLDAAPAAAEQSAGDVAREALEQHFVGDQQEAADPGHLEDAAALDEDDYAAAVQQQEEDDAARAEAAAEQ